jgi:hypothetical protein
VDIAQDRGGRHRQSLGPPGERQIHRDTLTDAEGAVAIVERVIQVDRARDGVGRRRRLNRVRSAGNATIAEGADRRTVSTAHIAHVAAKHRCANP